MVTWTDTQITARVAAGSLSGIARVQQGGILSNAVSFTVLGGSGAAVTMAPNVLNMIVGDTRTLQALDTSSHPVSGLTWNSSDDTIVSLSADDPPVLTALAAGHVTITAGAASADVTVWPAGTILPSGTILWSNPGNASGVYQIVSAIPSPTGVADVFAVQRDGTVQAITVDGTTAWTADLSDFSSPYLLPDFQGGLVVVEGTNSVPSKVVKLDGITGQRYPAYSAGPSYCWVLNPAIHPDGTIFATRTGCFRGDNAVIGIDPTTGTLKFEVQIPRVTGDDVPVNPYTLIIAGDGLAYALYTTGWSAQHTAPDPWNTYSQFAAFQVSSSGASNNFVLREFPRSTNYDQTCHCWPVQPVANSPHIITNADTGVLAAWYEWTGTAWALSLANVTSGGVAVATGPPLPHESSSPDLGLELQAQDGSFLGSSWDDAGTIHSFSFDASGNLHWVVPNVFPAIATADGGFIGYDTTGSGQVLSFDQNGSATGQMASLPVRSWTGNWYQYGSVDQLFVATVPYYLAASFWAQNGGQFSFGVAFIPIDAVSTDTVNNKASGVLSPARWNKFKNSHCNALFDVGLRDIWGNASYQTYDKTLKNVQDFQSKLNFYDTGNPSVANLTLNAVTGGLIRRSQNLADYLNFAQTRTWAAVLLFGRPGPIILAPRFFDQKVEQDPNTINPLSTLVHEVMLHAYAGATDDQILGRTGNPFFLNNGLYDDHAGSKTISDWIGTDCHCTPKYSDSCPANTAPWQQ